MRILSAMRYNIHGYFCHEKKYVLKFIYNLFYKSKALVACVEDNKFHVSPGIYVLY